MDASVDDRTALVVLATQLLRNGHSVTDADLIHLGAIGVDYFVRRDATARSVDEISSWVGPGDGRRVSARSYAEQLHLFATAAPGTVVVTRTSRGSRYLAGRLTCMPYRYDPTVFNEHPHVREVTWGAYLPSGTSLDGNRYTTVRFVESPELTAMIRMAAEG